MRLSLKYNERATHPLSAAFVRGSAPDVWLQEMNAWHIPLQQLVCFIISQNNNPLEAAGLFVIFKKEQMPGLFQVRHPYTVMGGKLYIPIDAELSPAISEPELQSLLIWDCQVFHPTIGFIGFERSDRIVLADLLQYLEPSPVNWEYAHAGQQPWVPLHQVGIQQLSTEQVFESVKESISNKPLTEIPKSNKKDVPGWLNNRVAEALFKGLYKLLSRLFALIPFGLFGAGGFNAGNVSNGAGTGRSGSGWFSSIINWMEEKIEDLEKQRDNELKRLTDMFEKNSDEALQYAIPLNSPYLNRGTTSKPSARLTRNPLQFNLGRLGGGYAVDGWNVDNYYNELRTKYLKAAQDAISRKDFKKAAYVYAHLLGDYASAAAALRQGKHYREAAVLYKEHVKNMSLAAACLEEGGIYIEAIELYTDLNQHEKAGDLYMLLDRKEPALQCYEKCVDRAAVSKDYLEEARIITDKIGDRSRAKKVLLNGWQDVKQPEACLLKYFDLVSDENNAHFHAAVLSFYREHVPVKNELSFLNVIDKVNKKYYSPEMENTCKEIAYEVVSEQVNAGNAGSLHSLRNFVPGDQLLTPDCYRFIHTFKHVPEQKPAASQLQLIKDVIWKQTLTWQNQLLVFGMKSSGLILARINGDRQVEYFSWNVPMEANLPLITLADSFNTNLVLVYNEQQVFTAKQLPANKHFQDELLVYSPGFLPQVLIGGCMHKGAVITLHNELEESFLNTYSLQGELLKSVRCTFNDKAYFIPAVTINEMLCSEEEYFLACDKMLLRISAEGKMGVLHYAEKPVRKFAVNVKESGVTIAMTFEDRVLFADLPADRFDRTPKRIEFNETLPQDVIILDDVWYVVAYKQKVQVYNLEENAPSVIHWEIETENDVVAVFSGSNRNQLGILEANGLITWHNFRESA
ncbi:hypothetical protein A3860_15275 [Niastella vici]|uniref:MoxR-vWA-beta-propeller ternary system domain-containing protein n=1 Tax=Niastella vici TaxID=1703345 RepID=A0A1V9G5N0_9BACT|nr:hypothetical protein [Niastella vici]OQP65949.1 hypothetical protein A3860_15275 [Niastella vici]